MNKELYELRLIIKAMMMSLAFDSANKVFPNMEQDEMESLKSTLRSLFTEDEITE